MTVSTSYAPLSFNGDDATTAFAVTWPFFDSSLVVTLVDSTGVETVKTITTHYTVSGGTDSDGLPATGTVTMLTAPASGETLRITRNTSKVQSSSWTNGGAYQAKTLEATLDKIILIAQETQAGINDGITGDVMMLNTSGATDYWDAESQIIRNVADATASTDAVNYSQLQSVLVTAGAGDVVGPASAVNSSLAAFDGTTGKLLKDAGIQLSSIAQAFTSSQTYTVGSGGDYATINAALTDLSTRYLSYQSPPIGVTLSLLSGFTMAEQVLVKGIDLSWIKIQSVDATVTITRSALTATIDTQSVYPAFGAAYGGFLPIIDALFTMDTSGTATGRTGVYVTENSRAIVLADAGVTNAGADGLSAERASIVAAHESIFSGAGQTGIRAVRSSRIDCSACDVSGSNIGLWAWRASVIDAHTAPDCSGCTQYGQYALGSSIITSDQANCSNAGTHGVYALNNCMITASDVNCDSAGTNGIRAQSGSIVSCPSGQANGCGSYGIYALYGSRVSAQSFDASGNTGFGIGALAAQIDFVGGNARVGVSDAANDIFVSQGGIIHAASATGGTSIRTNYLHPNGIIWTLDTHTPTPVVIGRSGSGNSHTGDTNETTLATVTVPGGAMGGSGWIRITSLWTFTNSTNNKTPRIRFGGTSGTVYWSTTFATTGQIATQVQTIICNRGAANSQLGAPSNYDGFGTATTSLVTSAVDTTSDVDIVFSAQLANSGEAITLQRYMVELIPS